MIASVVATLDDGGVNLQNVIDELRNLPCVEVGEFVSNTRRLPITIDLSAPDALEEMTRRIQDCSGVSFVDVVYVHFEDAPETQSLSHSRKPNRS